MLKLLHLFVFSLLISTAFAQTDKHEVSLPAWQALVAKSGLTLKQVSGSTKHIPETLFTKVVDNANQEELEAWIQNYPQEVESFLSLPEIARLSPARKHLGLKLQSEPYLQHAFMQWLESAQISNDRLHFVAPHCPIPRRTGDPTYDAQIYDAALQDWMRLFPEEYEKLINEPGLSGLNPVEKDWHEIKPCIECQQFTLMTVGKRQPVFGDYDSGNPKLDLKRYELATRHWFFRYDTETYLKQYDVADPLIDMEMSPGANIRFDESEPKTVGDE